MNQKEINKKKITCLIKKKERIWERKLQKQFWGSSSIYFFRKATTEKTRCKAFQLAFLRPLSLNKCQSTTGVCLHIQVNWGRLILAWGDGIRSEDSWFVSPAYLLICIGQISIVLYHHLFPIRKWKLN